MPRSASRYRGRGLRFRGGGGGRRKGGRLGSAAARRASVVPDHGGWFLVERYSTYAVRSLVDRVVGGASDAVPGIPDVQEYEERPPVLAEVQLADGTSLTDVPVRPSQTVRDVTVVCASVAGFAGDDRAPLLGLFVKMMPSKFPIPRPCRNQGGSGREYWAWLGLGGLGVGRLGALGKPGLGPWTSLPKGTRRTSRETPSGAAEGRAMPGSLAGGAERCPRLACCARCVGP